MRHRTREAVKLPDSNAIEQALVGIGHQAIQFWPRVFRTGETGVDILAGNRPASALTIVAKFTRLHFCGLLTRAATAIKCDTHSLASLGFCTDTHGAFRASVIRKCP